MQSMRMIVTVTCLFVGLFAGLERPTFHSRAISHLPNPDCTPLLPAMAPTVIDFEDLVAGNGGLKITNQYQDKGIIFGNATVLDYSAIKKEFPHSGKNVLESCFNLQSNLEACSAPITMSFTQNQRRVKVWVGFSYQGSFKIYLRGFYRRFGKDLGITSFITVKEPNTRVLIVSSGKSPAPYWMYPLEIVSTSANLFRAEVGIVNPPVNTKTPLAIDDVEIQ